MTHPTLSSKTLGQNHLWGPGAPGADSMPGLYAWDPRVKLALLILAVGANVYVARLGLSAALFLASLGLAVWSRVPARLFGLFFLAPAWATLVVFLGFSAGFGTTPVFSAGPLTFYREGMVQGMSAAARVACDMGWIAAVFLTSPWSLRTRASSPWKTPGISWPPREAVGALT